MSHLRFALLGALLSLLFGGAGALRAHEPYLLLTANADGTFTVETGFSDGASAEGLPLVVRDRTTGAVLSEHFLPKDGKLTLKIPAAPYRVVFDGGPGHRISKPGPENEKPVAATPAPVPATVTAPLPPVPAGVASADVSKSVAALPAPMTALATDVSVAAKPPLAAPGSSAPVPGRVAHVHAPAPAALGDDTTRLVLIVGIFFLFGALAFALGYGAGRRGP